MRPITLPGVLLLAIIPGVARAQVELRGRLLAQTGDPIPGATILLRSVGYSVRSDSSGRFTLGGQPGATLVLFFSRPGYRADSAVVVLPRGGILDRDFTLTSADAPDPEPNPSATMLRGRVLDESGAPLSYANVQINYGRRTVADDSGRFQLQYPGEGSSTVIVRRIGFESRELTFPSRPDTALRVVLTAIPAQLKEVTVTAAASAFRSLDVHNFYGRMRDAERGINHGYFITPEDIERRKPVWVTQMVDGLPTVHVWRSPKGPTWDRVLGSRDCEMTVYLDNIRVTNKLRGGSDFVNELMQGSHLAAMEIYPRAVNAPPAYQPLNGNCGVVLIWTK